VSQARKSTLVCFLRKRSRQRFDLRLLAFWCAAGLLLPHSTRRPRALAGTHLWQAVRRRVEACGSFPSGRAPNRRDSGSACAGALLQRLLQRTCVEPTRRCSEPSASRLQRCRARQAAVLRSAWAAACLGLAAAKRFTAPPQQSRGCLLELLALFTPPADCSFPVFWQAGALAAPLRSSAALAFTGGYVFFSPRSGPQNLLPTRSLSCCFPPASWRTPPRESSELAAAALKRR